MSAGVLAVMKADALAAQEWRFKQAGDAFAFAACKTSNEARAAVAELIDAAYAVEKLATLHDGDDRMFDRLRAAIARVQGGAK